MTGVVDQHLVVHLYAPMDGPSAGPGYADLLRLWAGCRQRLGMLEPVADTGLPHHLPRSVQDLPAVNGTIKELPVALQERGGSEDQAIVRLHYDVLNMSAHLTSGDWLASDDQWSEVADRHTAHLLGDVRVHTGRLTEDTIEAAGTSALGLAARAHLPPGPEGERWWERGVVVEPGVAVWEISPPDDQAQSRRFLAIADPDAADILSAWVWSSGDTVIPPLARYLLHAAKLRYQARVFVRDSPALHAPADAVFTATSVVEMRRTVEIAISNMVSALGGATPGGPFARDRDLANWLATALADAEVYLEADVRRATARSLATRVALHRAERLTDLQRTEAEITRRVFVIHGRDSAVCDGMFRFLRALGLLPLEWEDVVALTGSAAPTINEAVLNGARMAQAVVVLLTPEDVVSLHPSLHDHDEEEAETKPTLQPRPNVLIEMGVALALHPRSTVIVRAGRIKRFADTDGLNYIKLSPSEKPLRKIATRLRNAGCPVNMDGSEWRDLDWLRDLDAYDRSPGITRNPSARRRLNYGPK